MYPTTQFLQRPFLNTHEVSGGPGPPREADRILQALNPAFQNDNSTHWGLGLITVVKDTIIKLKLTSGKNLYEYLVTIGIITTLLAIVMMVTKVMMVMLKTLNQYCSS